MIQYHTMGWNEYYRSARKESFGSHVEIFREVAKRLGEADCPMFYPNRKMVIVLGGFHTGLESPDSFYQYSRDEHNNTEDRLILVDMNKQPFRDLCHPERFYALIQSRLEDLTLPDNLKADLIFLDCTFNFMTVNQIRLFAQKAYELLDQDGKIVLLAKNPVARVFEELLARFIIDKVPVHYHLLEEVRNLVRPHLKIIAANECSRDLYMAVLAKPEFPMNEFTREPHFLTIT